MKSARFLKMIESSRGIGFLYHLSEPFYGSHHVFLGMDRLAHTCTHRGEFSDTIPWLIPETSDNREVLEGLGYMVAT